MGSIFDPPDPAQQEADPAYQAWKQKPTPDNRSQLLKAVRPIIDQSLRSYGGGNAQSPLLRSRAKLMALKAMETYDPNRGKLKTHLLSQLQGLQRVSAQQQQLVSTPERIRIGRYQLGQANKELEDRLGREPSAAELADHTGLSVKRIATLQRASQPIAHSTLVDPDNPNSFEPGTTMPGPDPGHEAWSEMVYADLDGTNQLIMDYLLGKHGKPRKGVTEIAKMLNVSPGAISQRAARIQSMLDEQYTSKLF